MRTALVVALACSALLLSARHAAAEPLLLCDTQKDCPEGRFCQSGACQRAPALGDDAALFGLGLPPVVAPRGGADAALAEEATRRLRRVLLALGTFQVIPTHNYSQALYFEVPSPTGFDATGWHSAGAFAVLFGALWTTTSSDVMLEVRAFEVESGESVPLEDVRQRFQPADMALAVRRIATALAVYYTGRPPTVYDTRIAFTRKVGDGVKEIFTLGLQDEEEQQETNWGSLSLLPGWSRDGRLAYTSYRDGNPDLWFDGQKLSGRPDLNTGAAFSPDGTVVAATLGMDGDAEIYLLERATGKILRRLTTDPAIDTTPTWSPDGRRIAFVSDRTGMPQIFLMNSDGSDQHPIVFDGYNTNPCWSPMGDVVAYDHMVAADRSDVYTVEVATGVIHRLTYGPMSNEDPSYSPDGRQLVFVSTRDGIQQLYLMSANGSNVRRFTTGPGPYGSPAWSPVLAPPAAAQ